MVYPKHVTWTAEKSMHCTSLRLKFFLLAISVSTALLEPSKYAWANPRAEELCNKATTEFKDLKSKDLAIKHIDQALAIEPNNAHFWQIKAGFLQGNQESEKALPCINKSLQLDNKPGYPHKLKAEILNSLNRFDEALASVNCAISRNPQPDYFYSRAKIFMKHGKLDLAEKELDKLIDSNPNDMMAHTQRASVAIRAKHWPKAIADLTYSINKSPVKNLSYYEDLLSRTEAYTETKQYEKAIADCKTGLKGQPEARQFHAALVKIYELSGNASEAKRARKELETVDNDLQPPKSFGF